MPVDKRNGTDFVGRTAKAAETAGHGKASA